MASGEISASSCEHPKRVRVDGAPGSQRLLAAEPIRAGDFILELNGQRVAQPSTYSVQIGAGVHILPRAHEGDPQGDPCIWRNLNHSCDASARLSGTRLLATRDIGVGGEITFDYNTTEYEMATPFECGCGACGVALAGETGGGGGNGRGRVGGFRLLSAERRRALWPIASEHVRAMALAEGLEGT